MASATVRPASLSRGPVSINGRREALVEFLVPFELDRQQIDNVERGANHFDWQPAKNAAQKVAYAEDRAIFEGYCGRYRRHPRGNQQSAHDAAEGRARVTLTPFPRR
jgi:hypothetical protein